MTMNWENEHYVRLYTRDTAPWLNLSLEAQGLWPLLLRKATPHGVLELGAGGKSEIALLLGHPTRSPAVLMAVDELIERGMVAIRGEFLIFPNYAPALPTHKRERRARPA